jgi:VIT1/CCC1 family predicted Fe2+/Mn2+ transporter
MKDTYKEIRTFRYENAVVRVYRPELTEEETARRMKAIHKAAADLLSASKKTDKEGEINHEKDVKKNYFNAYASYYDSLGLN